MKKLYRNLTYLLILIISVTILIPNVLAESATISVSGANVTQGDNFTVKVNVGSVNTSDGRVYSFGGTVDYDKDKLSYGGCTSTKILDGGAIYGVKIGLYDSSYDKGVSSGTLVTCSFTAISTGQAWVKIKEAIVNNIQTDEVPVTSVQGTINIAAPKSKNANLSSLSVSNCPINFSSGNTNYSCSVDTNVTSVNVSASPEDGGASVSGTGNKSLNYGNNKISVTVKAPAGNTQTYNITVNRKDNRSGDNSLSSLSVSGGNLSPSFNANNTNYSIEVPFSVSSLNLKYNTSDSKATVKVNNNNLVAEETTNVTIVVTAENGSTKTYTIAAKRGKDPNKVLSTDNNLLTLTVDTGILSPAFTSEQTNYAVYLPYEVSKINISYEVSDKKYGVVSYNGPEELGVGNNIYTISVKAENNDEKVYTITVVRAKLLNGESSNNSLLASLTMVNATLTEEFDSGVHLYYYNTSSKKDIVVEAIAQDPDSVVTYLEAGAGVYAVLVTSPSGNMSIYIMLPVKDKGTLIVIVIVVAILLIAIIILIIKKLKNKKNDNIKKKDKKKSKKKEVENEE